MKAALGQLQLQWEDKEANLKLVETYMDLLAEKGTDLFLLPEMAVMLVFVFIPMIYALYLSFIKWNGFQKDRSFVALENYELIFKNHEFWASIKVTFIYMAAYVTLLFLLSLA